MLSSSLRTVTLVTAFLVGSISSPAFAEDTTFTAKNLNEQSVLAATWMQASGEFKALSYQAFNLAKMQFDAFSDSHTGNKKIAIVVDADEAVIDNGAYQAWLIDKDFGYSSSTWAKWMDAGEATAMPGATEFLNYVAKSGGEVFYVTNRKVVGLEGTRKNLIELGFPNVDDDHLMLRTSTSDKEPRRQAVQANYDIALFIGDNLNDFSSDFHTKSLEDTLAAVEKNKALFGTQFIMLPNPAYGDWEGKVYDNNWGASPAEKSQMRKDRLRIWEPAE
ncbi:5'-nucleotidase [Marinomonas ushuaiensis DSM 15871]|uniref:5'-nucleotidase n=1 Tax=Marinomonas ushuaiensis DSM 15871 TaxID=1122207 RepID=X7E5N3_9GAMM|nr:5'-nucleotidase, lipoprotein e(P4) family [Marinomonas ushuaiensis]ETX11364.1 5'-nucleotidase [Marinomonas ushuaiensis DSM 15871]